MAKPRNERKKELELIKKEIGQTIDIAGEYENHKHDNTPTKNDWHYVTIKSEDVHKKKYTWSNRAKAKWSLTRQGNSNMFDVGQECPYYKDGHTVAEILFDK